MLEQGEIIRVHVTAKRRDLPNPWVLRVTRVYRSIYTDNAITVVEDVEEEGARYLLKGYHETRRRNAVREWTGLSYAEDNGLPVPSPVARGEIDEGVPVLITEIVSPRMLYNAHDPRLYHQAGNLTARVHSIAPPSSTTTPQILYSSVPHKTALSLCINLLSREDTLPRFITQAAREIVNRWSYARPLQVRFCHGDLHTAQFLHDENGHMWIIDWETWYAGDPIFDLAFFIYNVGIFLSPARELITAFAQGYGSLRSLSVADILTMRAALLYRITLKGGAHGHKTMEEQTAQIERLRLMQSWWPDTWPWPIGAGAQAIQKDGR